MTNTERLPEQAYWVTLSKVNGIGAARFAALLEVCGDAEQVWRAPIHQLQQANLDKRSLESLLLARRQLSPAQEWERIARSQVTVVTLRDDNYPTNLRHLDGIPPVLYVRGSIDEADELAVAIVGTRRASSYGREVAHNLSLDFAHAGVTVVSGLALGVDTVAHQAALAAGGRTIAVLGSSVDQIYPPQNRALAESIIRQGALVSEYPLGTPPTASNFPPRNRIISGLSRAVVIVEAGQQSGALITAQFAADQGRDLYAVPGSILHPGSSGCNELIRNGAIPLLSSSDLLSELKSESVALQREIRRTLPTDPLEMKLLALLSQEPRHIDDILRHSQLPAAQVNSLLMMMELKGYVRAAGAMCYVKVL